MNAVVFKIPVPSNFQFEDGTFLEFPFNGESVSIRIKHLIGANIHSYTDKDVSWLDSDREEVVDYKATAEFKNGDRFSFKYVYLRREDEEPLGAMRRKPYTVFEVAYEVENVRGVLDNFDEHCSRSLAIVQRTIEYYKAVTGKTPASDLHNHENVSLIDVRVVDGCSSLRDAIANPPSDAARKLRWRDPDTNPNETIGDDDLRTIDTFLSRDRELSVDRKILIDAKERLYRTGEYKLAVILAETFFEVLMQRLLKAACNRDCIDTLMWGQNEMRADSAIEKAGVNVLLNWIDAHFIPNISERKAQWYNNTYQLRNDIIHRGRREVTEQEAKTALKSAVEFALLIEKEIT